MRAINPTILTVALAATLSAAFLASGQAPPPPAGRPAAPAGQAAKPATDQNRGAGTARPAEQRLSFDFKDPKGVNAVGFLVDSTLEPIFGTGSEISGSVEFSPLDPLSATGTLRINAKAVRCTNDRMTEVLHGPDWLDVANHPTVEIRLVSVESVEPRSANSFKIEAKAEVEIKGTTREMTLPLLATYLPGRLGDRLRGATGDLLVLRSRFTVNRSEFAINVATSPDVVAEEIMITASIVGMRKTG